MYAILSRCDIFGSAQTMNLICLVMALFGHNLADVLLRLGAVLVYMTAIALTVYLPKHTSVQLPALSLTINGIVFVILGFLPEEMNPLLGLYPIFFATAFQWSTFPGACGFNSSTIFSTNNLKQFTSAAAEVLLNHDNTFKKKAAFYGCTLLSFHAGAAVCFLLWQYFRIKTAWFALIPTIFTGTCLPLFFRHDHDHDSRHDQQNTRELFHRNLL